MGGQRLLPHPGAVRRARRPARRLLRPPRGAALRLRGLRRRRALGRRLAGLRLAGREHRRLRRRGVDALPGERRDDRQPGAAGEPWPRDRRLLGDRRQRADARAAAGGRADRGDRLAGALRPAGGGRREPRRGRGAEGRQPPARRARAVRHDGSRRPLRRSHGAAGGADAGARLGLGLARDAEPPRRRPRGARRLRRARAAHPPPAARRRPAAQPPPAWHRPGDVRCADDHHQLHHLHGDLLPARARLRPAARLPGARPGGRHPAGLQRPHRAIDRPDRCPRPGPLRLPARRRRSRLAGALRRQRQLRAAAAGPAAARPEHRPDVHLAAHRPQQRGRGGGARRRQRPRPHRALDRRRRRHDDPRRSHPRRRRPCSRPRPLRNRPAILCFFSSTRRTSVRTPAAQGGDPGRGGTSCTFFVECPGRQLNPNLQKS